jgi:hypothetical protein
VTRAVLPRRVDCPGLRIVPVRHRESSLNAIDNNERTRSSFSVKRNAAVSDTQFRFCSLRSCNFRLSSAFQSAYFFFVISECSVCSFSFRCKLLICALFSRNLLCYPKRDRYAATTVMGGQSTHQVLSLHLCIAAHDPLLKQSPNLSHVLSRKPRLEVQLVP